MADDARIWIKALRNSCDHLGALIDDMDVAALTGPSYCDDWTVAQVLSHLGSGAEIFSLMIEAGLAGEDPPGSEIFSPIWDAWNSKSPDLQAADCKGADEALVEQIESLDAPQLDKFHLSMFGMEVDATRLVGMRLSEHSLHSWDVEVARNPSATLATDATTLLIDVLSERVARSAKPVGGPMTVRIETTAPSRSFVLRVDEAVSLDQGVGSLDQGLGSASGGAGGDAETDRGPAMLALPGEALLRLASGRLDDGHLPAEMTLEGVTLGELRGVFPGF
jgi:uncharacterized protein (TIGR03083 family)